MEKKDIKKAKLWLVSVVVLVLVVNIAFAMVMKPLVQKSSNIEDYMRPGINTSTDSGEGVKLLAVVTTAPEGKSSLIQAENLSYKVQIKPIGDPIDEIEKKSKNSSPLDWVVKPLNQIVTYLFELTQETPTIESSLGDNLNTGYLLSPFE